MFESPKKTKKFLKIALFGKSGTGKTEFALSFPSPAVIDTEKGTDPFIEKYDFKVKAINRWKDLEPVLKHLQKDRGDRHTLIIDSATIFYGDLINDLVEYVKNKRGNEILSAGDWGVEKRRWGAFLNILTFLPMHVIITFREKDEYVEVVGRDGQESRKKSGEVYPEADRVTEYIFDLAFRCYTEENKKQKSSRFFVQCVKTRWRWMPKYSVHEVTGKNVFNTLFQEHVKAMMDAPAQEQEDTPREPLVIVDAQPPKEEPKKEVTEQELEKPVERKELPPQETGKERVKELRGFFAGGQPEDPPATPEDIKVLLTRCGDMTWPDGRRFSSEDGKKMIKNLYDLESTKDLKKWQFEFLYREFGEVLSGRSILAMDEAGIPFVAVRSEG